MAYDQPKSQVEVQEHLANKDGWKMSEAEVKAALTPLMKGKFPVFETVSGVGRQWTEVPSVNFTVEAGSSFTAMLASKLFGKEFSKLDPKQQKLIVNLDLGARIAGLSTPQMHPGDEVHIYSRGGAMKLNLLSTGSHQSSDFALFEKTSSAVSATMDQSRLNREILKGETVMEIAKRTGSVVAVMRALGLDATMAGRRKFLMAHEACVDFINGKADKKIDKANVATTYTGTAKQNGAFLEWLVTNHESLLVHVAILPTSAGAGASSAPSVATTTTPSPASIPVPASAPEPEVVSEPPTPIPASMPTSATAPAPTSASAPTPATAPVLEPVPVPVPSASTSTRTGGSGGVHDFDYTPSPSSESASVLTPAPTPTPAPVVASEPVVPAPTVAPSAGASSPSTAPTVVAGAPAPASAPTPEPAEVATKREARIQKAIANLDGSPIQHDEDFLRYIETAYAEYVDPENMGRLSEDLKTRGILLASEDISDVKIGGTSGSRADAGYNYTVRSGVEEFGITICFRQESGGEYFSALGAGPGLGTKFSTFYDAFSNGVKKYRPKTSDVVPASSAPAVAPTTTPAPTPTYTPPSTIKMHRGTEAKDDFGKNLTYIAPSDELEGAYIYENADGEQFYVLRDKSVMDSLQSYLLEMVKEYVAKDYSAYGEVVLLTSADANAVEFRVGDKAFKITITPGSHTRLSTGGVIIKAFNYKIEKGPFVLNGVSVKYDTANPVFDGYINTRPDDEWSTTVSRIIIDDLKQSAEKAEAEAERAPEAPSYALEQIDGGYQIFHDRRAYFFPDSQVGTENTIGASYNELVLGTFATDLASGTWELPKPTVTEATFLAEVVKQNPTLFPDGPLFYASGDRKDGEVNVLDTQHGTVIGRDHTTGAGHIVLVQGDTLED